MPSACPDNIDDPQSLSLLVNDKGHHSLVIITEERVSYHRLARTFRHRIPGVFQKLEETLQQRAVPYLFGQPVQLVEGPPRGSRRTCGSHPAIPVRGNVPDKGIRASLEGVLNSLLVPRPGVGDRAQAPLSEHAPYLLEACKIVRGIEGLIVLCPELRTMRRRKHFEDRSRVVARVSRPDRLQELGSHTLNLQRSSREAPALQCLDLSIYMHDPVATNSAVGRGDAHRAAQSGAADTAVAVRHLSEVLLVVVVALRHN
jgi:hypothetical protein